MSLYRLWLKNIFKQKQNLEFQVTKRTAELKQKAEELNVERQQLFTLLDTLPAFVFLQAKDYSIIFANRMLRNSFAGLGEKPCYEVFYGQKKPCLDCPTLRVFESNQPQTYEWTPVDGRTYHLSVYPFSDIDGTPLVLKHAIDITDRKLAEKEKIKYERMQVILEMAGATCHEFNQPLQIISGYCDLLMQGLTKETPYFEKLQTIRIQIDRLSEIIQKIHKLTRYKTKEYIDGQKIIDIDNSSDRQK